jgi:hypothetical protein
MVICFVQNSFSRTTQELEYLFFLSRKARIFFPDLTLGVYGINKTSKATVQQLSQYYIYTCFYVN